MSKRAALLLLVALVAVPLGLAAVYFVRTDPARAEAVLARLAIPDEWKLADAEVDRGILLGSSVTRYYLAPGDPESVTAQTRDMLLTAGFAPGDRNGVPACSSNHVPPHTSCSLDVPLTDGLWRMQWVVRDRRGGALIRDAPWFAGSSDDEMVVRVIVHY